MRTFKHYKCPHYFSKNEKLATSTFNYYHFLQNVPPVDDFDKTSLKQGVVNLSLS